MKRLTILLTALLLLVIDVKAVMKEAGLDQTLSILRSELAKSYRDMSERQAVSREHTQQNFAELQKIYRNSQQNALMLYSQKLDYVFDLTYACHEATTQYNEFLRKQLPFQLLLNSSKSEMARYDSLITSLHAMPAMMLADSSRVNRSVCLALAVGIRNLLEEQSEQMEGFITIYDNTEQRLQRLNDYANKRYQDIQTSIFRNGGSNYFRILSQLDMRWREMLAVVKKKYSLESNVGSEWNSQWIVGLFVSIVFFFIIATLLNQIAFRLLMPKRLQTERFMKKRRYVILVTTIITFAVLMGVLQGADQNFLSMAGNLLVEFAWLMGVILVSLLLRVEGRQMGSALRIYMPLLVVGLLVIVFRIILIPSELVNMIFPVILLLSTLWQWMVVRHHHQRIPRSDMFNGYISLIVFFVSLACSWSGYTLLSVQLLIWWVIQLTCVLTITCVSQYLKIYGEKHQMDGKPITQTWFYGLLSKVLLPVAGILSVMLSFYWAADVFNLSDLCWKLFKYEFVNIENLKLSVVRLSTVACLWFLFSYVNSSTLSLLRMHYMDKDPTTADSRTMMGKNVIQIIIWGAWLLLSLSILDISLAWLLAISGGLSTGIGFASKDIIENIYYGASLMTGRVKVGDWIDVDGTMGRVTSINYTSTVVESLFGEVITFTNSQLFAKNYKNLTRNHGYVLAVVPFGVAYGSNLRQVSQLVEDAVNGLRHQWIDKKKQVKSVVSEMGDSSVNFKLFVWADAVKRAYVVSDVLKCVYDTLGANGIEIPFPQRDIHIVSEVAGQKE
ncbi:MAG: mechanosensitive ion channel [Prevotella sp.]|nr:mechanosensitive ion channel [Prevotella sp.]